MRRRLIAVLVFLLVAVGGYAQSLWRIEVGTGIAPIHMSWVGNVPPWNLEKELADKGQVINKSDGFYPNVFISGVCNYKEHWEFVLTGDVAWSHHALMQCEAYEGGFDPAGKPRYNISKRSKIGMKDSSPIVSGTLQCRYLWNPWSKVKLYSGAGIGVASGEWVFPTPCVTPIGLRVGGRHIYGFAEITIGPYAYLAAGGLGYTF